MKMLPVFLTNKKTIEMPIMHNCERIILNKLVCNYRGNFDINNCTIYFNGTPVKYQKKSKPGRTVFFVDGIPSNVKSFHLLSPCHVNFMLAFSCPEEEKQFYSAVKFSLHLSLELTSNHPRS